MVNSVMSNEINELSRDKITLQSKKAMNKKDFNSGQLEGSSWQERELVFTAGGSLFYLYTESFVAESLLKASGQPLKEWTSSQQLTLAGDAVVFSNRLLLSRSSD